jgi:hypothetical protein
LHIPAEKSNCGQKQWQILEENYRRTGSIDILYELTLARYGYIGYSLGVGNRAEAREHISLAEESIKKLEASPLYDILRLCPSGSSLCIQDIYGPMEGGFLGPKKHEPD